MRMLARNATRLRMVGTACQQVPLATGADRRSSNFKQTARPLSPPALRRTRKHSDEH